MNILFHKPKNGDYIRRPIDLIYRGLLDLDDINIVEDVRDCDYIFAIPHKSRPIDMNFLESHKDKVVYIDYEDESQLGIKDPFLYFKRSCMGKLNEDGTRDWVTDKNVLPISYGCFDEMFLEDPSERNIDIGCFLRPDWECRVRVLNLINQSFSEYNKHIGQVNASSRTSFNMPYLSKLHDSKIIITSNPEGWEGDSRTWEALASGALVFVDEMYTPLENELIDGVHCVMYRHTLKGYAELVRKIKYYLDNPDLARKIGECGRNFVKEYHMPKNRVEYIIKHIHAKS